MMHSGIGSVLPPPELTGHGVINAWVDGRRWTVFRTARAALAALLRQNKVRRIWLPAYICRAVTEGVAAADTDIAWYGTDLRLNGVVSDLDLVPGDAVLCVDYFGRSVDTGLRALSDQKRDILWIEDRAQALQPELPPFGDVLLYSPRKLFGVGDGGLLASYGPLPKPAQPEIDAQYDDWKPNDARAVDPHGITPDAWFQAFRSREATMNSDPCVMSARTLDSLARVDAGEEATARRCNWARLAHQLADCALWPDLAVDFAPLAYPILVPDASTLSAHLAENRIWCARHWPDLPSPKSFTAAHELSRRCLSLPLDGRYGDAEMDRIAAAVRQYFAYQPR